MRIEHGLGWTAIITSLALSASALTLVVKLSGVSERQHQFLTEGCQALSERVLLAEEKAQRLSSEIEAISCKQDLFVAISRIGWWAPELLVGLRQCKVKSTNESGS